MICARVWHAMYFPLMSPLDQNMLFDLRHYLENLAACRVILSGIETSMPKESSYGCVDVDP